MNSEMWIVGTLLTSILLIVVTIVKGKVHPFLALLLASFYVGALMGMNPLKMVNAMEEGIGGTLGFLAAVIGLGTILGKMMEVSGAAERIGLACSSAAGCRPGDHGAGRAGMRYHPVCGGGCGAAHSAGLLHRPQDQHLAADPGHSALYRPDGRALHSATPPRRPLCHQSAGCRCGIRHRLWPRGRVVCLAGSGPLFLKLLGKRVPFKEVPAAFADIQARNEDELPTLGASLFTVLLPILLMLVKTVAELNMDHASHLYTLLEFIGNPITAMFIAAFTAYYVLGIRRRMQMEGLLDQTEQCFSSIANILLIIGAGGAFNGYSRPVALGRPGHHSLPARHASHPAGLAGGHRAARRRGLRHRRHDGGYRHRLPIMVHYPNISPEIMTLAIGSGAIGCTMVTDSLFWLVKQYCGATLNETLKYYTTATFVASLMALAGTFLLSCIV